MFKKAIQNYREIHKTNWSPSTLPIINRIRSLSEIARDGTNLSSSIHVLDLAPVTGAVLPHVDSLEYVRVSTEDRCNPTQVGKVVCGLSLLSASIMRLERASTRCGVHFRMLTLPRSVVEVLIPRRSLYIMRYISIIASANVPVSRGLSLNIT